MRKLVIRWLAMAVALTLLALGCVRLGEWQLNRLESRRARNEVIRTNQATAPVPYAEVMADGVDATEAWRQVTLAGTYTGEQYQVRYRNVGDAPGIEVAAVLKTDDGAEILVDRGFIPREQGQPDTEVLPEVPTGPVTITGYAHADEPGKSNAIAPHEFKVRLINSEAIGRSLDRDLVPGYVVLIKSVPAETAALQPVGTPELGEGNHFSYALQWFAFGLIAIVGIGVLIRADLVDRRKALVAEQRQQARANRARVQAAQSTTADE